MGQPTSLHAYPQARALWDKALFSTNGIKVGLTWKKATNLRFSMYALRKKEKEESRKIYEEGDPLFNASPWDSLQISIQDPAPDSEDDDRPVHLLILTGEFALEGLEITDPLTGEPI